MTPELEERLFNKFPKLFQKNLLAYGFEHLDGWYGLIHDLAETITALDPEGSIIAVQVKEKFGGLRFYVDISDEDIDNTSIYKAEALSFETCESCGAEGKLNGEGYWLSVRCEPCRTAEKKAKEERDACSDD